MSAPRPFTIRVDDAVIEDLHRRIDATIWPQTIDGAGWDYGTDIDELRELVDYWRRRYDWRAHERELNRYANHLVAVDGLDLHCIHARGVGPAPLPLVITHGWPSSVFEMLPIIGPLSDPAAHGGDPRDAFHVIAPSLPGYGWSQPPRERGMSASRVADLWVSLMRAFGYERFAAHGGDWGSAVTTALGAKYADRLIAMHVNMLAPPVDPAKLTPEQRAWWAGVAAYRDREWGYVHLQRTKPQTLSFALTDSPVGLAAWILEKWWRWSDIEDASGRRNLWNRYTRDEILTTITIYWVTRSIGPSLRMYSETFGSGSLIAQPARSEVPLGMASFKEMNRPPRALVEPWYNVQRWVEIDDGGHFPARENPRALVHELREFFRPLR
jgi:microsomal epoxide hydrolase